MEEHIAEYFNIQKYSIHDGPGIRTTLFLKGCPLRCLWCSNPESQKTGAQLFYNFNLCRNCGKCVSICPESAISSDEEGRKLIQADKCTMCRKCLKACRFRALSHYGKTITVSEAKEAVLKDRSFYTTSGGGVTVSGGEPFMQVEFLEELLRELKKSAIHTAIETCGYTKWKNIERVLPYTDLFLFDMKEFDSETHKALTGVDNKLIHENLKKLGSIPTVKVWVRMPIIPTFNDNAERIAQFSAIANELKNLELIELLPYHQFGRAKYTGLSMNYEVSEDVLPPTNEFMLNLQKKLSKSFCVPVLYKNAD